jgi:hypothetical protein
MPLLAHHKLVRLIINELALGGKTGDDLRFSLKQRIQSDTSQQELLNSIESGNLYRMLKSMQKYGLVTCLGSVYQLAEGVKVEEYKE